MPRKNVIFVPYTGMKYHTAFCQVDMNERQIFLVIFSSMKRSNKTCHRKKMILPQGKVETCLICRIIHLQTERCKYTFLLNGKSCSCYDYDREPELVIKSLLNFSKAE